MYALGVERGDRLVAVATAGHPTGQWGQSGRVESKNVLELTRVASDGTTLGASSKLVSRILDLLGKSGRGDPDAPKLFVTYQLTTEAGTTYEALRQHPAGLRPVEFVRGTTPHGARSGGVEEDEALAELDKIRWEAGPAALPAKWSLLEPQPEQMGLFGKSLSFVLLKGGKPPKGFTPIPRVKKGGYRKLVGNRWIYWYPGARGQLSMF
jgi:hypothetical protein